MNDPILESFLSEQQRLGAELASESDILTLDEVAAQAGRSLIT